MVKAYQRVGFFVGTLVLVSGFGCSVRQPVAIDTSAGMPVEPSAYTYFGIESPVEQLNEHLTLLESVEKVSQ